jgi:hypothetical protein
LKSIGKTYYYSGSSERSDSTKAQSFKDNFSLSVTHFGKIYEKEDRENIVEEVKMNPYFPRFVDEATNKR